MKKIHFDMNGFYQCVAVHQEIYAQQTFSVQIDSNGKLQIRLINYSYFLLFSQDKFTS